MPRVEVLTEVSGADPEALLTKHAPEMLADERDADPIVEPVKRDSEASIIGFLAQHPGNTAGDLAKGLNLNPGSLWGRLAQLARIGQITKASPGYSTTQAVRSRRSQRPLHRAH
jgi:Winged helix-turn-helix DNA-binding